MASIPLGIQDLCYGLSYLPVLGLCIHQRVLRGQSEDWIWKCLWAMVAVWTAWFAAHDSQLCFCLFFFLLVLFCWFCFVCFFCLFCFVCFFCLFFWFFFLLGSDFLPPPHVFYRLGIKEPWPSFADRKFSVSFNYKHNLINYLYCEWMNYNRECASRESERVLEIIIRTSIFQLFTILFKLFCRVLTQWFHYCYLL